MKVVPLKRVATIRVSNVDKKSVEGDPPVRLCNYTDVYYRGTIHPAQQFMEATATPDQLAAFRLKPGDVIITKDSETADDIGVPAYVQDGAADIVCGYHLAIIRPIKDQIDGRFLYWCMVSTAMREQLAIGATGVTRFGLRTEAIGAATVSWTTHSQQGAIADFLDAETAHIDALISKKRQLVTVLSERQRWILQREIEQFSTGNLPLRRMLLTPPQYGASESGEPGNSEWPRYIRITDLHSNGSLRGDNIKRLPPEIARPYRLRDGDLLFARSGATAGKAFRYRGSMGDACFAGYLIRMRVDSARALPEFIELWTRTSHYWDQILSSTVQATIQNVNADRYLSLLVPAVPRLAQEALVARLNLDPPVRVSCDCVS